MAKPPTKGRSIFLGKTASRRYGVANAPMKPMSSRRRKGERTNEKRPIQKDGAFRLTGIDV